MKHFSFLFLLLTVFCLLVSCRKDTSPLGRSPGQPDTTSHNFVWQEYTFGTEGSYFNDVFAINKSDVWVVGTISIRDSNGILTKYNSVHWDGNQWELVGFKEGGFILSVIRGIWVFSPSDIWLASGSIFHSNGIGTVISYRRDIYTQETVERLWASSPSNIYGVGNEGLIVHYDGSGWQKIEVGTTINLTDIWGSGSDNIWVCGHETATLESILLHYNGSSWQTVWKTGMSSPPYSRFTHLHSLWFEDGDSIIIVGDSLYYQSQEDVHVMRKPENPFYYFQYSVRGSAYNNVFVAGTFGSLWHYNGENWQNYPSLSISGRLNSLSVFKDNIYAVGYKRIDPIIRYALIYHGIQQ